MSKEISFSDFLKEGALKEEKHPEDDQSSKSKPIRFEAEAPASEKETKAFWKELRHFFRTSERPPGKNGSLVPALLAPILRDGSYTNEYPVFVDEQKEKCISLSQLLSDTLEKTFSEKEARILKTNMPRALREFNELCAQADNHAQFEQGWERAAEALRSVDVRGKQEDKYKDDILRFGQALPNQGSLIRFSEESVHQMLNLQLQRKTRHRNVFAKKLKKQLSSLRELLTADAKRKSAKASDEEARETDGLDFVSDMISIEKISELLPSEAAEGYSAYQKAKIKDVIKGLEEGIEFLERHDAYFIITASLYDEYNWDAILLKAQINKAESNEGYRLTEKIFDENIKAFTSLISAHRMAALIIEKSYKDAIHNDFFENFSRHHLSADEMLLFPPISFVGETFGYLKNNLSKFSALLSLNKPIRLISLEKRLINPTDPTISWEDASHGFRQELASIAIAHRSTHTFQCAINYAESAYQGMGAAFDVDAPAFMHFLIPQKEEVKLSEVLKLASAVESRFFPAISYDLRDSDKWGSRFDISINPHPDLDWPVYELDYQDVDGDNKSMALHFTYADYKCLTKHKIEELMLIPDSIQNENLIQLADYLISDIQDLTDKVPFIYLVNESNCLKRAALPYMWVVSCQERLDNWNFVQELGGINSYHVKEALSREKLKWEEAKKNEIDSLLELHKKTLEETRRKSASDAMENLSNALLGLDALNFKSAQTNHVDQNSAETAPKKDEASKKDALPKETEESAKVVEADESAEPWVESFKCTTCNECTEKFPHIFEYNEDKQAYIKPGAKAKFAELVDAAEECPANCIHTGLPQNNAETGLEELIKRAEKYI